MAPVGHAQAIPGDDETSCKVAEATLVSTEWSDGLLFRRLKPEYY